MKNYSSSQLRLPGVFCLVLWVASLSAQVVLSPVAVVATDIATYPNATITVTNMINQSGVTTPFVSGGTVFDTYFANPGQVFATSGNGGTNNWQSQLGSDLGYQGDIDFDLGAVYQINKLAIWNRSLSNVTVKVFTVLGGPEQVVGDFTLNNRQSYNFSYPVDMLPFNATYQGRYVRLSINSIYATPGFSFGYVIVGEVVASVSLAGPTPPTVNVTHDPNGEVTVTFTGTLQTSTTIDGIFTNVPGNPSDHYTMPKASLLPEQFFRAQGN